MEERVAEQTSMLIEPLQAQQLSEWASLIKKYFEEIRLDPEFHRFDIDVAAPLAAYASNQGAVWLAHNPDTGKPVGLAAIKAIAKRTAELKRMYVVPEERRKGLGHQLWQRVLEFAKKAEYLEILLAIRPDQRPALAFCEKFGFKPCARYGEDHRAGIFMSYKFPSNF